MGENNASTAPSLTVCDLGRHRPARIRQLRRGRGRLLEDVGDTLAEIQGESKELESNQRFVFVVEVERRSGRSRRRWRRRRRR